ncbi:MAG: AEC family transporter [Magnetospiraceae bacterium]
MPNAIGTGDLFSLLFTIIAPVFFCVLIGYVWQRRGLPFQAEFVTGVTSNVAMPCLVFSAFLKTGLSLDDLGVAFVAAAVLVVMFGVIGWVALKALKLGIRDFLPPIMFPNCGNMGLPLCLLAFGDVGLALAMVYFTTFAMAHLTFGIFLISDDRSLKRLTRLPLLYGLLGALAFTATGIEPPRFMVETASLLGGMAVPLMLLALGVSLGSLGIGNPLRALMVSAIRLGGGFGAGLIVVWLFNFEGVEAGIVLIQSSMPVAVLNFLLAQQFGTNYREVASTVLMSTLLSVVTIPLVLLYALPGGG